jgi:hypothetical protein
LNVHGAGGVRQTETNAGEPSVPERSASDAEVAVGKLKRCKSPGVVQIPAEPIQAGAETLRSEIHELIKLIWSKEELRNQWNRQLSHLLKKRGLKLIVVIIEAYHCCQLHTKLYPTFFFVG